MSTDQDDLDHLKTAITKTHSYQVSYTWVVEDFNFHEAKGDEMQSPIFSARTNDECKWNLSIFPNGQYNNPSKNILSVYLNSQFGNEIGQVFANVEFHVLDDQSEGYSIHHSEVLKYGLNCKTWNKVLYFATKDEEFRSKYLRNNKLTIRCDLKYSLMGENDISSFEVTNCNVCEGVAKLYENPEFIDVIISVNGKSYPAHKNILSMSSPVFAAMFRHDTKENELNRVEIEDMKQEEVGEMLRYIYTGKCENLTNLAEGLLAAADKYDLDQLKMMCARELIKKFSVENVANVLTFAEMHNANALKIGAIKFIASRVDQVMKTEGWIKLYSNRQLMEEVLLALYHGSLPMDKK